MFKYNLFLFDNSNPKKKNGKQIPQDQLSVLVSMSMSLTC